MQKRYSKQRELIIRDLRSRHDHPTAEMVYNSVKKACPSISLATVYRNLGELASCGEILRITIGGTDHFDGHTNRHFHLVCNKCGRIFDHEFTKADDEFLKVPQENFIPSEINVTVYGICGKCDSVQKINKI